MDKYLPCRRRPTILRRTRFCRGWLHPLEFHSAENLSTFLVELRLSWSPKNKIHDHLGKRGNASEKTGRLARHSRTHLVSHQPYQTVILSPLEYKTERLDWNSLSHHPERVFCSCKYSVGIRINLVLPSEAGTS